MKKGIIIAAAFLVVCLLAFLFVVLSGPSDAAYITTATVKTSSLVSDIDYSGVIEAERNVPVTSDTGGRVLSVNALLGQTVKKDDVLFTVDSTDIQLQYNQAAASYEVAKANYEKVTGGAVKESEMQQNQALVRAENEFDDATEAFQIAQAQYNNNTTVAAAQSAYDIAKADYDRISFLVSVGQESEYSLSSAKSKVDSAAAQLEIAKSSAKTAFNSAQSRLKNAQTALDNAQKDYKLTVGTLNPENVKGAQAQLDGAKAALDIVRRKLDNTSVKAPASGQISLSDVEEGDVIAPQTPVMTIISTGNMEMTLHVTESGIGQVYAGMPVQISILGTGETYEGEVEAAAAAMDEKTGLIDVKVSMDNSGGKLKAGMHANVKLIPADQTRKVYVPVQAVISADSNPYVYVIENNRLKKVSIVLGEKKYAYVEVTQGLSVDAQVVVQGNAQVNENSAFRIVKTVS